MGARKLNGFSSDAEVLAYVATRVSRFTGVQLGDKQKSLVEGRLARRMRELKLDSISEYGRHLLANEDKELNALTSLLTTHHTYFFREMAHFDFLLEQTLPAVIESHRRIGQKKIRIWSAACSRGQEVYSLAMFLKHHLRQLAPDMDFSILGTDIDAESVGIAKNGVYPWAEIKSVPALYMNGNWQRGTGEIADFVRAKDDIRKHCEFKVANLLDFESAIGSGEFDVIFCRNVFIYFSREDIARISKRMLEKLSSRGQLLVGMSESLNGLDVPVSWVGPSIYEPARAARSDSATTANGATSVRPAGAAQPQAKPQPIRVVCVDDSKTVLTLLGRILTRDFGFEVVGTAMNGHEAAKVVRELKPDVVTLDIHMPQMTGLEYLERHFGVGHPPVVMVSSVSREDASLAFRCVELGATDYVEKPSMDKLKEQSEEIRAKLKSALLAGRSPSKASERLDASFSRNESTSVDVSRSLRLIVAPSSRIADVERILAAARRPQPPTIIMVDRDPRNVSIRVPGTDASQKVQVLDAFSSLSVAGGELAVAGPDAASAVRRLTKGKAVSVLILGDAPLSARDVLSDSPQAHVILEDGKRAPVGLTVSTSVPQTSFAYESDRFLMTAGGAKK